MISISKRRAWSIGIAIYAAGVVSCLVLSLVTIELIFFTHWEAL